MRKPALVRSLMVVGLAAVSLGTAGCNATYWQDFVNMSTVRADVKTPGKLTWTQKFDEAGDLIDAKCVYTNPTITLMLDANSAPVNYTTAQADFFYTEGTTNDAGKLATNSLQDIPTQYFPFATQLRSIDRATAPTTQTVVLDGLIPQKLIDITNPRNAGQGYQALTAVVATVTLKGTNGVGSPITTKVNVTITTDYK